jgi:primosomal protein N' (replication factor Y)
MMKPSVVEVLLPLPFEQEFSYLADESAIGDIVQVSFRRKQYYGVVRKINDVPTETTYEIKPVLHNSGYKIPKAMLEFLDFVSFYNMIPRGMVYKMAVSAPKVFENLANAQATCQNYSFADIHLSSEQQQAFYDITNLAPIEHFNVVVLQGVTGSGKTEVYLKWVQELVKAGKQVVILLPEILLTTQLLERFVQRLGDVVVEWHSALTPATRAKNWRAVYNNEAKVIVGPRSALFLPFPHLGAVIVDEEHDASFKQEEQGCYNGRDMAVMRAKFFKVPILLSSATPSVETEYNVRLGKYHKVNLNHRYGAGCMPKLEVIDLLANKLRSGQWISSVLRQHMQTNILRGKQTLLYMNRRGYSMVSLCRECRGKIVCPNCEFNLVKHKHKEVLLCHYCGYSESTGKDCKNCGGKESFSDVGPGVERIAEEIASFMPDARVLVLSSDTLDNKNKAETAIAQVMEHQVDVIIGTQMITKGLHFPKLDLVGILDADMGLMSGDIRAYEKTYQIIKQVSGRAGRESDKGLVCLQTLEPESYLVQNIVDDSWEEFITQELSNRQAAGMPPFSRLVNIIISSASQETAFKATNKLARLKPEIQGVNILGPAPAPLHVLRNRFRYRYIAIFDKEVNFTIIIKHWIHKAQLTKAVEVRIDVDPISFT